MRGEEGGSDEAGHGEYPPPHHLLRDLRIVVERTDGGAVASIPLTPEMLDDAGHARAGVVATLVDVIAGETAIRAIRPHWTATSDLRLDVGPLPGEGTIEARPRLLRKGRQAVVLEAVLRHRESGDELGLATLGFAVLRARGRVQQSGDWERAPDPRTEFARANSRLSKPLLATLGVEPDPFQVGIVRLALSPYLVNSLGAMQGGAIATLAEAAADRHATSLFGGPVAVRSLAVHYLELARVGPVRATSRRIAETGGGGLFRVELQDEGRAETRVTVATVAIDRLR